VALDSVLEHKAAEISALSPGWDAIEIYLAFSTM